MKKDKQWEKPQADVMKRKISKKVAKGCDARFGLGPLAPPMPPPYRPDFV
ncbi:MAG: hypothetical protein QMD11_07105 [Smithella sp.]|jgi:hypothetical protein|nr:hypothetical protein [Smithella sp.]